MLLKSRAIFDYHHFLGINTNALLYSLSYYKQFKLGKMKKVIILFVVIGIITLTAITIKPSFSNGKVSEGTKSELKIEKYKACIEACNSCIVSCKKVGHLCKKNEAMAEHGKLSKECITSLSNAVRFMNANSILAKRKCLECAITTEKYAIECDKFDMPDCKKCAISCRKTSTFCNETSKHRY
jgi:hypothetical protein